MKTKHWLKLTFLAFIPFMFLFMFYGMISMSHVMGLNGLTDLVAGNVDNEFVAGCSFIAFVALIVFLWTAMKVFPHSDDIDDLQAAKQEYYKATNDAEKLKEKYLQLIDDLVVKNIIKDLTDK